MSNGPGCLSLIVGVLLVGGLLSMCGGGSGSGGADADGATQACHGWVTDELKAPSTADFTGDDVSGNGPWTISGSVDAENSFGAKIRSSWTCEVRLESGYYKGNASVDG